MATGCLVGFTAGRRARWPGRHRRAAGVVVSWRHLVVAGALAAALFGAAVSVGTPGERELTDEEVAERHRAWMEEHGRVYADEAERVRRLGIFRDNLRYVEAHNRGGHSYTLGLNQFSDLTDEEFRATFLGSLLEPDAGALPSGDPGGAGREDEESGGTAI